MFLNWLLLSLKNTFGLCVSFEDAGASLDCPVTLSGWAGLFYGDSRVATNLDGFVCFFPIFILHSFSSLIVLSSTLGMVT